MARRRLTLKRIDPWSVLKFGFVVNLALLAIWLLGAGVIWFFIRQLQLIDKVCEIARDVGFVECGVNGGNLFRALLLLGLLGTVIQTGLMVFLAFLHNLIADLVGGLQFTFNDESAPSASGGARTRRSSESAPPPPLGTEDRTQRAGGDAETADTDHGPERPSQTERVGTGGRGGSADDATTTRSTSAENDERSGGWDLFGPSGSS